MSFAIIHRLLVLACRQNKVAPGVFVEAVDSITGRHWTTDQTGWTGDTDNFIASLARPGELQWFAHWDGKTTNISVALEQPDTLVLVRTRLEILAERCRYT